ncbi:hypothetical protein GHT06_012118 [Daphnia sinensis]|uniref:Uncharacterized protein n=1 Tax=Daphnia sinensis TaxID=1820382 RepID=A0AAD5KVA9_9CRUS|nr:hypothetical protein GHT06_012118 [Daphnia sinensis]
MKLIVALTFATLMAVSFANPTHSYGYEAEPYGEYYSYGASPYYGYYDLAHFGYDREISSYGYYVGPSPNNHGQEESSDGHEGSADGQGISE